MNDATIDMRAPVPADRAVWGRLWGGYLRFYGTELPAAAHDAAFAQLLSDAPGTFAGRIARKGAHAVGLVVRWLHHAHMWRPEGVTYLQDLRTAPGARGRGIARRLIETVYAAADANGTPRVHWLTQEGNHPACILYDRIARTSDFIRYDRLA